MMKFAAIVRSESGLEVALATVTASSEALARPAIEAQMASVGWAPTLPAWLNTGSIIKALPKVREVSVDEAEAIEYGS